MIHGLREQDQPLGNDSYSRLARSTNRPARSSSPLKFFASSSPAKVEDQRESQKAWTANYLADLRSNRPARPSGSRPLVQRNAYSTPVPAVEPTLRPSSALALSRPSCSTQQTDSYRAAAPDRCSSAMSHGRSNSTLQLVGHPGEARNASSVGEPHPSISRDLSSSRASTRVPVTPLSGFYIERGQRRVEKQEARMLREALEEVDQRDEARLYAAAQDEASDLVWKHQNPQAPYKYREASSIPRPHSGFGDNEEAQRLGYVASEKARGNQMPVKRCASIGRTSSKSEKGRPHGIQFSSMSSTVEGKASCEKNTATDGTKGNELCDTPREKAYPNSESQLLQMKPFGRRRVSGTKSRKPSGGLFSNPDDKIYEEPEAAKDDGQQPVHRDPVTAPLKLRPRNSIARLQSVSYGLLRSKAVPEVDNKRPSRSEIYRNPPSQSRNPAYTRNKPTANQFEKRHDRFDEVSTEKSTTKDGIEIRGEDIRAATSMRMKDRSPKLPSPTIVSEGPRRPIVSFDHDWKPKNLDSEQDRPSTRDGLRPLPSTIPSNPQLPESTASAPIVPTIKASGPPSIQVINSSIPSIKVSAVPSISVSTTPSVSAARAGIPCISISDSPELIEPPPSTHGSSRPSPFKRPLPHHSSTAPVSTSAPHWSPSMHQRPTAQCAACALPIAGRIVSAASQRFHPHCFTCFHCGELLECVAFYPEPTIHRDSRLARIELRAFDTNSPDVIDGRTAVDDGDSSSRFYCHLDFHELFSPRCRSCKTPIEGEVVLACGGEWHKGHFFCAQCGDPFDEKTPFVEKDGYAWCVGCHAGRFNGKCKGCKRVILEQGVQALGGEWHEGCFCCVVCGGAFQDGRFFTRGDDEKPVCVGCEERRLKA